MCLKSSYIYTISHAGNTIVRPGDHLWSFGTSLGPITWSQVNCAGSERSVFDCNFSMDVSGCTHALDVGVLCHNSTRKSSEAKREDDSLQVHNSTV